jgi:NAD(P)H-quinone oxidoreductase subunit 5
LPALALYALFGGHGPFSVWLLLGLAFSVIIVQRSSRAGAGSLLQFMGFASGVLLLYGLQKLVFSQLVVSGQPALGVWADVWLGFLFVLLYGGHIVLVCAGDIPVKRRLQRWLFAGLYLDEWSSRITLKLMPLRLPVQSQFRQPDLVFAKKVS